jgi:hypothetical protein
MKLRISKIKEVAAQRPEGYVLDVLSSGDVSDDGLWIEITTDEFKRLMEKYRPKIEEEPLKFLENFKPEELDHRVNLPSPAEMATSLVRSAAAWGKSGFAMADSDKLTARLDACKSCSEWDAAGMAGTGRCRKCGCSTQAKLRIDSEKCPLGKW